MPVGVREAVGGAVAEVAVDPPDAEPGRLDRRDAPVERRRAPRAQREVPEPSLRGLREHQAVAEVVAPAAQVDGLPFARLLLHAEHVDEEAEALVGLRRQELRVGDAGEVVRAARITRAPGRLRLPPAPEPGSAAA